jgi:hypothetical protein
MMSRNRLELRKFGLIMAGGFAVLALIGVLRTHPGIASRALGGLSVVLLILALAAPGFLAPFHWAWMRLGEILGWINTRLLLCLVYFMIVTPLRVARRMFNKDPLRWRLKKDIESYWIKRQNKAFNPDTYFRQY